MDNEKVMMLILDELKGIKKEQEKTNDRLGNVEGRLDSVEGRLDRMEVRMDDMEADLKDVKRLAYATFEKVAELVEFKTETEQKLAEHDRDINMLKSIQKAV